MKIGELAKRAGVGRDTIRFYERNGLIHSSPSTASTNNYRDYPEESIERLQMIREAQQAGFSISELSKFIQQLEQSTEDFDLEQFLQTKIDEVEERIRQAQKFVRTLKATKHALAMNDD